MTEPDERARARGPARWWDRLAGARVDLSPLKESRDFRVLFFSGAIAFLCSTFTYVAIPFQLYALTGSNLAVGAMGVVQLIPLVVFGLWGGALADRVDRRRMLLWTGLASAVLMAALVVNAVLDSPQVWLLYLVGALSAVSNALNRPSKEAIIPRVVRYDQIPSAIALDGLTFQLGMLVGPGIAGLVLANINVATTYVIGLAGVSVSTVVLLRLASYPPIGTGGEVDAASNRGRASLRSIVDGVKYAARRRDLLGTYVIDMVGMFLAMPVVLFPALAEHVFVRPELLGLLYSAEAVGSMVASLSSGWTSKVHHHGRAVTLAAIGWGAFIGLAGLMPNVWLAIVFFAIAGALDMVSGLFRGTLWHQTIPDHMRGRLAGIEMLSYSIGPLGGQLRSGLVADLTSVRTSIVSGGLLCVLGVTATARLLRDFWSYDARTDEHAVRQRAVRAARDGRATE